jgi:hypothetical protein
MTRIVSRTEAVGTKVIGPATQVYVTVAANAPGVLLMVCRTALINLSFGHDLKSE